MANGNLLGQIAGRPPQGFAQSFAQAQPIFQGISDRKAQTQAGLDQAEQQELTGGILQAGFAGQAIDKADLDRLGRLDPSVRLQVSEMFGIPPNEEARLIGFTRSIRTANKLAQAGEIDEALRFVIREQNISKASGADTSKTDNLIREFSENEGLAVANLLALDTSLTAAGVLPGEDEKFLGAKPTAKQLEFAQLKRLQESGDPLAETFALGTGFASRRAGAQEVAEVSAARAGAKGKAGRGQGFINAGLQAADSTGNLRRSLELLSSVETGGFDNAALKAKRLFGIESADEGELSNKLGSAVLSQLKETFGSAFTEGEGNRLTALSAGFGKSPAANKRILEQALKLADRVARRGISAAESSGDEFAAQEIRDALEFVLTPDEPAETTAPKGAAPQAVAPSGSFASPGGVSFTVN